MTLAELIEISEEYADLGWSLQDQLAAVLRGEDLNEQNQAALRYILDFLSIIPEEIQGIEELTERLQEHLNE